MSAAVSPANQIKRVVVRGVSWVGDAVMTIPALRELRRVLPQAHITLATRAWAEGIFADAHYLNDLLIEEKPHNLRELLKQTSEWRRRKFDLAVVLQNSFQSALVPFAARVLFRVGYANDGRSFLLTRSVAVPVWRRERHEVYFYLHLIAELEEWLTGSSQVNEREPSYRIDVSAARLDAAKQFLRENNINLHQPLVVLCPGSTNSRAKRWPADYYAALADQLITEAGATVALIGSGEELNVTNQVASAMKQHAIVLTGRTELSMTTALLNFADLIITNDTGPAHIAASLDRPTIVIFGPTDPVQTRPFAPAGEIIREPPVCAPCMLRDCPIDHRCMTMITPAQVYARAAAILNAKVQFAETIK